MGPSEMETFLQLRALTVKRMEAFDAGDLKGCMEQFIDDSTFGICAPDAEDVVISGFAAINELEEGFMRAISDNFGRSFHDIGEWRSESIGDDRASISCYFKLWLTDKESGDWHQQDLSGKSGRFWLVLKHVKVGSEWKLQSQTALSED